MTALIAHALGSYSDYLEKTRQASRIVAILERLEREFAEGLALPAWPAGENGAPEAMAGEPLAPAAVKGQLVTAS